MAADHWAVVPAAGGGTRFGLSTPKQYQLLAGRAVLAHALDVLLASPRIAGVVVVLSGRDTHWPVLAYRHRKPVLTTPGGMTRAASVLAGLDRLATLKSPPAAVLVHDAARPLLASEDLQALLAVALDDAGAALACTVVDTVRTATADWRAGATLARETLWLMQTPQRFRYPVLLAALRSALAAGVALPDEVAAMQHAGYAPRLVPGRRDNFKITHAHDLPLAAAVLAQRAEAG